MGQAGPRPMRYGLYMGRSARPTRLPMCFDGPARTVASEMWCTTATTTTTSTVPLRRPTCFDGLARAVAHEMWCTTATTTTFLGVDGSLSVKNSYICTIHLWQIASGAYYNMMPCANVGQMPWCTDDTPCSLGDEGRVTFLPWFVPRPEPPQQLR